VPVLFLPSPNERRIRTIGTAEGPNYILQKPATCFEKVMA